MNNPTFISNEFPPRERPGEAWGIGRPSDIPQQLLWMHGPFGVGKSAIAQSCADSLAAKNKLCASIFFSRPNKRNNPDRVFTSIAYQLAVKFPPIGDILDREILKDPTILTAARPVQFEELLAKPLRQVNSQDAPVEGWVVILDGLDERAMGADDVSSLLYSIDLPLSSQDDHEILTFFEKEVDKIREEHNLPPSWCPESDVAVLVKLADGLWIYVDTVTRFIGDPNSSGPTSQLKLVLNLAKESRGNFSENPLSRMDMFYDLIMRQIPPNVYATYSTRIIHHGKNIFVRTGMSRLSSSRMIKRSTLLPVPSTLPRIPLKQRVRQVPRVLDLNAFSKAI